jgi:hypothetical protein
LILDASSLISAGFQKLKSTKKAGIAGLIIGF